MDKAIFFNTQRPELRACPTLGGTGGKDEELGPPACEEPRVHIDELEGTNAKRCDRRATRGNQGQILAAAGYT